MKSVKKTQILIMRLDQETKSYLQRSAQAYGTSMSSLVLATIKQVMRTGDMYLMLPENLRMPTNERREAAESFKHYMQSPRSGRTKRYSHPLG